MTSRALQSLDDYKRRVESYTNTKDRKEHMGAQNLLRAMIEHAPTEAGQATVARSIIGCESEDQSLRQLANHYFTGLIRPMKALGGRTPAVSHHPSRPSAEIQREVNAALAESAKHNQEALRTLSLRRDQYRCLITHKYDIATMSTTMPELEQPGREYDYTQACHIIPFALNQTDTGQNIDNTAGAYEIITMFSGISLDEFNGDDINRLENILTLPDGVRKSFGALNAWLEPIDDQPNSYKLKKAKNYFVAGIPDGSTITFTTPETKIPLPDPRYLGLHAACAKIAHASGATEEIDFYMRELETTKVLAEDGSSMGALEHAMSLGFVK